ncbi:MAG: glycoside hydrolase family 97 catalytic domain-containing protein [Acidobacteriota bacterium]
MRKTQRHQQVYSRRTFLVATLATPIGAFALHPRKGFAANPVKLVSPDGKVRFELLWRAGSRLGYQISFNNQMVIEASLLGILVNNVNLCQDVELVKTESYRLNESYATRGVHSEAINHANGAKFSVVHRESKTPCTLEVRAFNNGIAFRYVVHGSGERVPDEATGFRIPAGSIIWSHDFEGHYEGIHTRKMIGEVKPGEWAAPPLTIKLPNGLGYAAITEAALVGYSGMGLQADGQRGFQVQLGHAHPVSYPFRLRYESDVNRLARPAIITGTITTPWRVVMIGADLNALVNCDIIDSLSPPPDKKLLPQGIHTDWIKPGRAVWKYLDGGENTLAEMKNFSSLAGKLGFEYNLVEGFWQKWSEDEMRELVAHSRQHNVGVWFWKHSRDLRTAESRQQFFQLCNRVGVVGVKIDFFDHEAKEIIDLYQTLLKTAAEHRLMVNFHGANKPAGESRTFPNEMTREGIRGLEYRNMQTRAVHNTTLPFTRMLAGHADYTPVHFGERRRETSWAHQIASAAIFTSPVLIYGAHPKNILENPAVELIKTIPSTWDETMALPVCEIGELAAFARRKGDSWFLAVMNGSQAKTIKVALSFLGRSKYQALLARDKLDEAAAINLEQITVSPTEILPLELRAGGGFIGRFSKLSNHLT